MSVYTKATHCEQADVTICTVPSTNTANKQDVFIWTLFQLGGWDQSVDIDAIFPGVWSGQR